MQSESDDGWFGEIRRDWFGEVQRDWFGEVQCDWFGVGEVRPLWLGVKEGR